MLFPSALLLLHQGLMQKEVYNEIGLKQFITINSKRAWLNPPLIFWRNGPLIMALRLDELVHYSNATPKAVTVEDKTASLQVRLITQLNEKAKSTVMNIIDTMLTKQKFQNFFEQNIAVK